MSTLMSSKHQQNVFDKILRNPRALWHLGQLIRAVGILDIHSAWQKMCPWRTKSKRTATFFRETLPESTCNIKINTSSSIKRLWYSYFITINKKEYWDGNTPFLILRLLVIPILHNYLLHSKEYWDGNTSLVGESTCHMVVVVVGDTSLIRPQEEYKEKCPPPFLSYDLDVCKENTIIIKYCSSQPSLVHWLSSSIFPCSVVRSLSRYGNIRPNIHFFQYVQA